MIQEKLMISGMHCANCAMSIDDEVEELDGVSQSSTSYRKQMTTVVYDEERTNVDVIATAVRKLGYETRLS